MRISLIVENKGIKLGVGNPFSNLFVKKRKATTRRHQSKFVAMVFLIYLKVYIV